MISKHNKTLAFGPLVLCLLMLLFWSGCRPDSNLENETALENAENGIEGAENSGCNLPIGITTIKIDGIEIDLMIPEIKPQGDLLVFPPWNESRDQWCKITRLCSKATKRGYRVIMPEMGKSVFAQTVYPETREDWKAYPTLKWVRETMIPELRINHCMLLQGGQNFIIGATSGARGAVLLAEDMPDLFTAIAAFSGDYNPSEMPGDNIYRGFLGNYEDFPNRWETAENVLVGCASIKSAVYLGHGKADEMVDSQQTIALYNNLRKHNPDLNVKLNIAEDRGSDFIYWASELNNVFEFFESTKAGNPEGASQSNTKF